MQKAHQDRSAPTNQATQAVPPSLPRKPWVKPLFERVPLNEALAGIGAGEDANGYSS